MGNDFFDNKDAKNSLSEKHKKPAQKWACDTSHMEKDALQAEALRIRIEEMHSRIQESMQRANTASLRHRPKRPL